MRVVDVNATVEAGSLVEIKLPRLRVVVEQRQAERLRDVLNTVLPPAANTGKVARTLRLLHLWGDVDPEISGPYDSDEDRLAAAQDYRRAHGEENGVFKLDVTGDVEADVRVESYAGGDLEMPPKPKDAPKRSKWLNSVWVNGRNALVYITSDHQSVVVEAYALDGEGMPHKQKRAAFDRLIDAETCGRAWVANGHWKSCTLCRCTATGEVYGLPVCDYHTDHTEDDPRCPDCVPVHTGDRVLDGDQWRTVTRLDLAENTAYFADGGCMDIDEAGEREKRLPSEVLPS